MNMSKPFAALLLGGLLLLGHGGMTPAQALLAQHDCSFCHDFHGAISNAGLLKATSSEAVCLSCHYAAINTTKAATVHNPGNLASDQPGYITCRECHNPHDNIAGNIKLVGYKYDPQYNRRFLVPTIRQELPTSDPLNPVYKTVTFTSMTEPTADYYRHDGKGACEICHTSNHLVGKDCTKCHEHNKDFTPNPPKGFPATGSCTTCHTGTGTDANGFYSYAAYNVGPSGTHMKLKTTDAANAACTACHKHHAATPTVLIPNNATVGINYAANGEGGISLGGTATTGSTEAEICWNCHDQNGNGTLTDAGDISEWNGRAYLGYTVTNSKSWTAASFNPPGAVIPTRPTRSIHSANQSEVAAIGDVEEDVRNPSVKNNVNASGVLTGNTGNTNATKLEKVKYIRCSYCHDVHNTYGPNKDAVVNGVTISTYLRGTWMDNPYNPSNNVERPPESTENTASYYTGNNWGQINTAGTSQTFPRLYANSTGSGKTGGYFIDQNSNWPTWKTASSRFYTVDETAGLCKLCHNKSTDAMDYYDNATVSNLWRGTNGHSNSTLGGTNASGVNANLFDARRGLTSADPFYMGVQGAPTTSASKWGKDNNNNPWLTGTGNLKDFAPFGNSFSSQPADGGLAPPKNLGWYGEYNLTAGSYTTGRAPGNNYRPSQYATWWGTGIGTDGTINRGGESARAHNFSCSKCHTPHASGLPALLITNCLDYNLPKDSASGWSASGRDSQSTAAITVGPKATETFAVAVQVNCHRKESSATGWNKLAIKQ